MVHYVACFGVSFCTVSPSVCLDNSYLGLGSRVANFWEGAAHLIHRMFSLLCLFVPWLFPILVSSAGPCITLTRPCNIQQYFTAGKMFIFR